MKDYLDILAALVSIIFELLLEIFTALTRLLFTLGILFCFIFAPIFPFAVIIFLIIGLVNSL